MKPPAQSPEYRELTTAAECVAAQERCERVETAPREAGPDYVWREPAFVSESSWREHFLAEGKARVAIARPVEGVEEFDADAYAGRCIHSAMERSEWAQTQFTRDDALAKVCVAIVAGTIEAPASPKPVPSVAEAMESVQKLAARLQEAAYAAGRLDGEDGPSDEVRIKYASDRLDASSENLSIGVESYLRAYATEALRAQGVGGDAAVKDGRYAELIYAVGNKYPGESRHETALRYIRQAEMPSDDSAKATTSGEAK